MTEDTGSLVMECTVEPFTVGEEEPNSGVFSGNSGPKTKPALPEPALNADSLALSPPPALYSCLYLLFDTLTLAMLLICQLS